MAIGTGSRVGIRTYSTDLTLGQVTPQPPLFGIVEAASEGSNSVLWDNGIQGTAILDASLDEITDASPTAQALLGKTVAINNDASTYNAIVVDVYSRTANDVVLLKTLANGAFIEALASDVSVVVGA